MKPPKDEHGDSANLTGCYITKHFLSLNYKKQRCPILEYKEQKCVNSSNSICESVELLDQ